MKTKAQTKTPKKTYGPQTRRGDTGETHAARILRQAGYHVTLSPTHPRGFADIIATKGSTIRKIQVKRISSRTFTTADAARNRIRGKPFNVRRIPPGGELWIFDAKNNLYTFTK